MSSKPKKTVGRTNVVALETLATTAELKEILAKINVETLPDIRGAWVERLVERARCPECGGPLRMTRSKVVSECGWRLHLR